MRKTWLLSIAFAVGPTSALADPYQPTIIPGCQRLTLRSGEEACGYLEIAEWKSVLAADSELAMRRRQDEARDGAIVALRGEATALRSAIEHERAARGLIEQDRGRLRVDLVETDRLLQAERVKPRLGTGAPWWLVEGMAGALAVAVVVIAVQ